jgi:hypothetical protein
MAKAQTPGNNGAGAFEQAFKNIDDILWKEAGCTTELDYTEQTSWLLFLKYLDSLEQDKAGEAAHRPIAGKPGPRPKARTARSIATAPKPAKTSATSST